MRRSAAVVVGGDSICWGRSDVKRLGNVRSGFRRARGCDRGFLQHAAGAASPFGSVRGTTQATAVAEATRLGSDAGGDREATQVARQVWLRDARRAYGR